MKIASILSAVAVLCSVGCVNAFNAFNNGDNRVDFQFSDDQNGFVASAQYRNGYMNSGAYANDMRDFASRVNQNLNSAVSFTKADRETFNLDCFTNYSLKPNKMGIYECLNFDGFKCNSGLNEIGFSATNDYQPSVVLNFDSDDDANLPGIDAKYIPIMGFEVKNPTGKGMTLRNFKTNCTTGLSYNTPMYIGGCKCNNTNCDFRRPSILAEYDKCNSNYAKLSGYNGGKSWLGCGLCLDIPGLKLNGGLKVVGISNSVNRPTDAVKVLKEPYMLATINSAITSKGKFALYFPDKKTADRSEFGQAMRKLQKQLQAVKKWDLSTEAVKVLGGSWGEKYLIFDVA